MIVDFIEPVLDDVVFASYDGDIDQKSGLYHGTGSAVLDNDCTYQGKFSNGMFHGKGKFVWADGISFEGDFVFGKMYGKGTYTWHDGSTYKGEISNGQRHGTGKFTGSSGQLYEGDWREGKRCGNGKVWYNEEKTSSYVGEWVDNMRHGYGVMKYPSGNNYEGMWRCDQKHGNGVMTWRDVDELYTGSWSHGHPHGYGEHIWGDASAKTVKKQMCNLYRGYFVRGKREGLGTFFYMNGSQYTGEWSNDMKEGEGVFIHPDGKIFAGYFRTNRMVPLSDQDQVQPRATDDVNPQYSLNIEDVFQRYPLTLDKADNEQSYELRKKDVERVLLKYNHCIKQAHRRYCDASNKVRAREVLALLSAASSNTAGLNNHDKIVQTIQNARNFPKRLFCMDLRHMTSFLHDSGLVDSTFTSSDVGRCLRRMRGNTEATAVTMLREYKQKWAAIDGSEDVGFSDFEFDLQLGAVLDSYYDVAAENDRNFDIGGSQPILEREFCELLVRCVAEHASRQGGNIGQMTLYRTLYKALAENLLPFASDFEGRTPAFYGAFHQDSVGDLVNKPLFGRVWDILLTRSGGASSSGARGSTVRVRSLVEFLNTSGFLSPAADAASLLSSFFSEDGRVVDPSLVGVSINFGDFTELFCRVVLSDAWVYGAAPAAAESQEESAPAEVDPAADENAHANTAVTEGEEVQPSKADPVPLSKSELLVNRLTHLTDNFDVSSLSA